MQSLRQKFTKGHRSVELTVEGHLLGPIRTFIEKVYHHPGGSGVPLEILELNPLIHISGERQMQPRLAFLETRAILAAVSN